MLAESLNNYEGSFLLVSHDRFFISKTANKIWEIDNGEIKEFKGPYAEWVEWTKRMAAQAKPEPAPKKQAPPPPPVTAAAQPVSKDNKKLLQKQQRVVDQLDEKLSALKTVLAGWEAKLADPGIYGDKNKFRDTEKSYQATMKEIGETQKAYDTELEKLMELE